MKQSQTIREVLRRVRWAARALAGLLWMCAMPSAAQLESWTVGAPVDPPEDVEVVGFVSATIDGVSPAALPEYFFYDSGARRAYWLQPTPPGATATVTWPTLDRRARGRRRRRRALHEP